MFLVGKPEGKRPLGRPRRRWVDIIMMDLGNIEWGVDRIGLAQDRDKFRALVNAVMNLRFPRMLGGSRVAAQPEAFRIVLSSIQLLLLLLLLLIILRVYTARTAEALRTVYGLHAYWWCNGRHRPAAGSLAPNSSICNWSHVHGHVCTRHHFSL
jgi:hypothetical protein